jgi:hypothetical protein
MALEILGLDVEWYAKHFGERRETYDDDWLELCGLRGWTVIAHDRKFHKKTIEIEAIIQYNVGCFILGASQEKSWQKVRLLAKTWDGILERQSREAVPYMFQINADGTFRRRWPPFLPD